MVVQDTITKRQAAAGYALSMHRSAWITAACLIDWHRENAVEVVQRRLNELHEERERTGSSGDLEYWSEIARAVIAILRATREATIGLC
jgi:hypothetical protein